MVKYKYEGDEHRDLLAQEEERLKKIPRVQCTCCSRGDAIFSYVYRKDKDTGKAIRHILYEHVDERRLPSVFDVSGREHFRYRQCMSSAVISGLPTVVTAPTPEQRRQQREENRTLAMQSGIEMAYVYHCNRCGYYWLPRDYDPAYQDIMKMQPPKGCARCKSPSWRTSPLRRTKNSVYPNSVARTRALVRLGKIKIKKKTTSKHKK